MEGGRLDAFAIVTRAHTKLKGAKKGGPNLIPTKEGSWGKGDLKVSPINKIYCPFTLSNAMACVEKKEGLGGLWLRRNFNDGCSSIVGIKISTRVRTRICRFFTFLVVVAVVVVVVLFQTCGTCTLTFT